MVTVRYGKLLMKICYFGNVCLSCSQNNILVTAKDLNKNEEASGWDLQKSQKVSDWDVQKNKEANGWGVQKNKKRNGYVQKNQGANGSDLQSIGKKAWEGHTAKKNVWGVDKDKMTWVWCNYLIFIYLFFSLFPLSVSFSYLCFRSDTYCPAFFLLCPSPFILNNSAIVIFLKFFLIMHKKGTILINLQYKKSDVCMLEFRSYIYCSFLISFVVWFNNFVSSSCNYHLILCSTCFDYH